MFFTFIQTNKISFLNNNVLTLRNNIVPFFLELFPGASAAYSLRKLHPDAIFAIRVRRSLDGQEMDIGFTSTGELDEVALLLFVGSGDGFVVIWYDQSGNNNHASQAVASQQSKIVNAGVVIKENGKPALRFDGIDDELQTGNVISHSGETSSFAVINFDNPNSSYGAHGILQIGNVNKPVLLFADNNSLKYTYRYVVGEEAETTFPTRGIQFALTGITTAGGLVSIYQNGVKGTDSTYTPSSISSKPLSIGSLNGRLYFTNHIQELIFYPSDQSANRSDINTAIINHYEIP